MTDAPANAAPAKPRRRGFAIFLLLAVLLVAAAGWRGWSWWQAHQTQTSARAFKQAQQSRALDVRIDALRRDQRAQAQRLQQTNATNRILREEILGIGERAALLEDSIEKLTDPARNSVQTMRLDEVEFLLSMGAQRLQLAADLSGARHAYALAAGLLQGVDDPAWLNLQQTLAQERAALTALGEDPKTVAAAKLEAFAANLAPQSPRAESVANPALPWWRRALANIVQVRPANRTLAVAPDDRSAGYAALQLELTLAHAALERRDTDAWRNALTDADRWLRLLWPDSPSLRKQRVQLQSLRDLPLALTTPTLGSTLQQLRQMRSVR